MDFGVNEFSLAYKNKFFCITIYVRECFTFFWNKDYEFINFQCDVGIFDPDLLKKLDKKIKIENIEKYIIEAQEIQKELELILNKEILKYKNHKKVIKFNDEVKYLYDTYKDCFFILEKEANENKDNQKFFDIFIMLINDHLNSLTGSLNSDFEKIFEKLFKKIDKKYNANNNSI